MIKGLLARQGLQVANIVLILSIAAIAALIAREMLSMPVEPGPVTSAPDFEDAGSLDIAQVGERSAYDGILKRGLFGKAAAYDSTKKPTKPKPTPIKPATSTNTETRLPLTLKGTVTAGPTDPRSSAIIEVRSGRARTQAFYMDQEVIDDVFLKEVHHREVVLDNRQTNRLEVLRLDHTVSTKGNAPRRSPAARTRQRTSTVGTSRSNMITLDRVDISRKLEDEYARVASTLNVRVVRDENGKAQGITTDDIESSGVATELGFQNGDVLVSINNEPVDSRDKAAEVIRKYQNASIFRIGILRGGQPLYINYRVR